MNGEIPSVPITTLAGVASLTNLLPELPLPTPLPTTTYNRNLLYNAQLLEESRKTLQQSDALLVNQLGEALDKTFTDNIHIIDGLEGQHWEGESPALLKAILLRNPNTFQDSGVTDSLIDDAALATLHEDLPEVLVNGPVLSEEHQTLINGISGVSPLVDPSVSIFQSAFEQFARQQAEDAHLGSSNAGPHPDSCGVSHLQELAFPNHCVQPIPLNGDPANGLTPVPVPVNCHKHKKHKKGEYNVVTSPNTSSKLTLKITKAKSEKSQHKRKRESSTPDGSVNNDNSLDADGYTPSLGERVKRRRHIQYKEDSDDEENDSVPTPSKSRLKKNYDEYIPDFAGQPKISKGEQHLKAGLTKPLKLQMHKLKVGVEKPKNHGHPIVMLQDCMDFAPVQKKFIASIEDVLDTAQQMDLSDLNADDDDETAGVMEAVVTRVQLSKICSEAAKLNSTGLMNLVPTEKLVKLLTLLQYNIRLGLRTVPSMADEDGNDGDEMFRDLLLDKVLESADASLVAMYIMTSTDMPKEVYIEEVIEKVVRMVKLQLQNVIFPEFDPVYKADAKNSGSYQGNFKAKRARSSGSKNRHIVLMYNKLTDLIGHLARVVHIQELTDSIILQASTLAVGPFFVENISELQLNCLKLVTSIFTRYDKHRQLILEDILASLARLPTSKKNLRSYRLNSEEQIQMMTALCLQLIQCVVKLPKRRVDDDCLDPEVVIVTSFEHAMRTAHSFLSVFLSKCTTKGEEDYRPIFENFVYDLLTTVNKPEWPASEMLLSLLGRLLVTQFSNKSADMSLRVASLDNLGIVAARLRKDAVNSQLNEGVVDDIIKNINQKDEDIAQQADPASANNDKVKPEQDKGGGDADQINKKEKRDSDRFSKKKAKKRKSRRLSSDSSSSESFLKEEKKEEDKLAAAAALEQEKKMLTLQKSLLEYLGQTEESDEGLLFARQFYIGLWFRDSSMEAEKAAKTMQKYKSQGQKEDVVEEIEKMKLQQASAQRRKQQLLELIKSTVQKDNTRRFVSRLDYGSACLVTQYLASTRPFSHSFEIYLTQIEKVLRETAVAVRTRAMKCLTLVVEADPGILSRGDMQQSVHGRLLDQSTSVREAAVELVGKFILSKPELVSQYYKMLSERILDTGISVRKRVIKIFRDICIEQPEFEQIPEICVKMIRRVNDEEGIKKLVNETFQTMWFVPLARYDLSKLVTKVMNITDVVNACQDTGLEWFEHLIENLLKKEGDAKDKDKPVEKSCVQLIECLIENVLKLESSSDSSNTQGSCSPRLVSCIVTLYLFAKIKPEFLTRHCVTLHPYLNIKCSGPSDFIVIQHVAKILELAVPLIEHPNENFLAQLEEDMMKLIISQGTRVLQSCVSCISAVVMKVTKNYQLIKECFSRFFRMLTQLKHHCSQSNKKFLRDNFPALLRSLYTVGLLCQHFDFDSEDFGERTASVKEKTFELLMYFVEQDDEEICHKALTGIGFFVTRHYEFMLGPKLRELYQTYLSSTHVSIKMRCQILKNLQTYLTEEESRMMRAEEEWRRVHNKDDLKEMGDIQSGMASTIIQVYLKALLESFFHSDSGVRLSALTVICLVLKQGLVNPVEIVPYLISMGSDCDSRIHIKADQQLQEIDKKYPGFIQMKAMQGVKMSYRLQEILHVPGGSKAIRGLRPVDLDCVALNNFIYSLIRHQRTQRRSLITTMLNLFDDGLGTPLSELIYMADNLATFPYQAQDEPLFIIHQIDLKVSVCGSNVLQSYKEILFADLNSEERCQYDEDEDVDVQFLAGRLPEDVSELNALYLATQSCLLMLMLKQHLKDAFGLTDVKLQRYSPTENQKVWEKQLNRKRGVEFNPGHVLDVLTKLPLPNELDSEGGQQLVQDYLDFKDLMMTIDPADEVEDDDLPKQKPTEVQPNEAIMNHQTDSGITSAQDGDITVIDEEDEKVEREARNMCTPLTSSKSSYNKLLSLVTSSQSRKTKTEAPRTVKKTKVHKHKKKKKRRRVSDSDVSDSDSSDPDFTC